MIQRRSPREIDAIRESCKILVNTFHIIEQMIEIGMTTRAIDTEAEKYILSMGARPAFKGFSGYPASTCISIDDQVVHGIPGDARLEAGSIVSVDVGVKYKGYFGDAAKTYPVGHVDSARVKLVEVTRQALEKGISIIKPGIRLSDISHVIQTHVESAGFSVVRDLVGHGIGRKLHEEPQIPNYGPSNQGPVVREGMVFAIEPMVNMGSYHVFVGKDNWTVKTRDGRPSAHFEHTVAVTAQGADILTNGL
ncbi:MAG: type I methionyl aminopeptidase [Candidatus Zhuqueibacterota bacterium]